MTDEVSTGELARRWDEVVRRLDRLDEFLRELSLRLASLTDVYSRDQRETDRRFVELERDLAEEREARKAEVTQERQAREAAVRELKEQQRQQAAQRGTDWRQLLYNGLVPGLLFLLTMAVTILLAFRGGK